METNWDVGLSSPCNGVTLKIQRKGLIWESFPTPLAPRMPGFSPDLWKGRGRESGGLDMEPGLPGFLSSSGGGLGYGTEQGGRAGFHPQFEGRGGGKVFAPTHLFLGVEIHQEGFATRLDTSPGSALQSALGWRQGCGSGSLTPPEREAGTGTGNCGLTIPSPLQIGAGTPRGKRPPFPEAASVPPQSLYQDSWRGKTPCPLPQPGPCGVTGSISSHGTSLIFSPRLLSWCLALPQPWHLSAGAQDTWLPERRHHPNVEGGSCGRSCAQTPRTPGHSASAGRWSKASPPRVISSPWLLQAWVRAGLGPIAQPTGLLWRRLLSTSVVTPITGQGGPGNVQTRTCCALLVFPIMQLGKGLVSDWSVSLPAGFKVKIDDLRVPPVGPTHPTA